MAMHSLVDSDSRYEAMTIAQRKAVQDHRQRLKERGLVRLEVQAPETDRDLIRKIVGLLRGDPGRATEIRAKLRALVDEEPKPSLKALLASAPLEGIDLTRKQDLGRELPL